MTTRREMFSDYQYLLTLLPYPINPDARRCSYFMTKGFCEYQAKCNLHHPIYYQLNNMYQSNANYSKATKLWERLQRHAFFSCNEEDPACVEFFDHGKCHCDTSVKPLYHPLDLQLQPKFKRRTIHSIPFHLNPDGSYNRHFGKQQQREHQQKEIHEQKQKQQQGYHHYQHIRERERYHPYNKSTQQVRENDNGNRMMQPPKQAARSSLLPPPPPPPPPPFEVSNQSLSKQQQQQQQQQPKQENDNNNQCKLPSAPLDNKESHPEEQEHGLSVLSVLDEE